MARKPKIPSLHFAETGAEKTACGIFTAKTQTDSSWGTVSCVKCLKTTRHRKAFKFRLYPTENQEQYLRRLVGARRFIYNTLVREQNRQWRHVRTYFRRAAEPVATAEEKASARKHIFFPKPVGKEENASCYQIINELAAPYGGSGWLKDVSGNIRNHACGNFQDAQSRFMGSKGTIKPPTFAQKSPSGSFQFQDAKIASVNGTKPPDRRPGFDFVCVPLPHHIKVDPWIEFRRHRRLRGEPKTATVSCVAGLWYVSVLCEWTPKVKSPEHRKPGTAVGVDRNVRNLAGTSEGEIVDGNSKELARIEKLIRRLQAQASRLTEKEKVAKQPRSKRHRKLDDRVARLRHRQANIRNDVTNKLAHRLARDFEMVALEKLNVKAMTASAKGTKNEPGKNVKAKAGLNRGILNRGWGQLETKLQTKTTMYGGRVVEVPAPYTSQKCSACKHIDRQNRVGSIFKCVRCGHTEHADLNSPKNILADARALELRQAQACEAVPTLSGRTTPGCGVAGRREDQPESGKSSMTRQEAIKETSGAPEDPALKGATVPLHQLSQSYDPVAASGPVLSKSPESLETQEEQTVRAKKTLEARAKTFLLEGGEGTSRKTRGKILISQGIQKAPRNV